jgi:hypothetical protein
VPTEALHGTVCAEDEPVKAVKAAIALARTAGGPDNITALVAIFDGEGLKPPLGSDDQPRFVEFDPMEEGEAALSTTSRVGRRLAARAGVTDDPGPLPIPATGQHRAVRAPNGGEGGSGDGDVAGGGPASAALQERARIGLLAWAMAVIALIAVGALLLWDRL